jgi:hypothetical protein
MSPRKSPLASRASIFQRTDTGVPELSEPSDVQTSGHSNVMSSGEGTMAPSSPRRIKRTFHLPPEDVLLLDELQLTDHRRTGKKPELSALVSEAIRLLRDQRNPAI